MQTYVIKKNIDIPPHPVPQFGGRELKYPWPYMEEGDCFDIPAENRDEAQKLGTTAQSSGISWCNRNRKNFTIRYRSYHSYARVWMVRKKK